MFLCDCVCVVCVIYVCVVDLSCECGILVYVSACHMGGYGVTCILFVCVGYVWYVCPMYSVHTVFVQACHM